MEDNYKKRLDEALDKNPPLPVADMLIKAAWAMKNHKKIMVSVSGGSDSDIMLDALHRLDPEGKATYVYFATGMEYQATKRHLQEQAEKYDIKIEEVPPILPIPTCCAKYGVPFWSKRVSEMIYRLQRHNFQWEDESFDVLIKKYPKCRCALRWWCNTFPRKDNGGESSLNINYAPYLKEYMIANPPPPISAKCCEKAKKEPAAKYREEHEFDLDCTGVRKTEGGNRALTFKNCFSSRAGDADQYRPLFWLTDKDKQDYKDAFGVVNSDCYEVWGMKRTGCPGCPYGKEFEQELELMQKYEPKFYRAALKIFGASYEYTRGYLKFREEMKQKKEAEAWMQ